MCTIHASFTQFSRSSPGRVGEEREILTERTNLQADDGGHGMTQPFRVVAWMAGILLSILILAILVWGRLVEIFSANPFFNTVILGVLLAGVAANFRQVILLAREVDWIEGFRQSTPELSLLRQPRLLAPMARMLMGRDQGRSALSASSMRTILDSVQLRLEESRDLSRYLIGLSIFLGLLGTFWGLLVTIRSVADIIGSLDVGVDALNMFSTLKENIKVPLGGMATSFSTSLFGLSSSLVIGFLDLQAGHAQNRFYNELEEWLSGMTRLSSGSHVEAEASVPAYVEALLEQTADGLERLQRSFSDNERERQMANHQIGALAQQIERLNELMMRDNRDRHVNAAALDELRSVLKQIAHASQPEARLTDELRTEFRLLTRTIAAAMEERHPKGRAAP